ncbi:MAG: cation diffusion facilitator family transporter [Desulfohalobiaceae bacterium]|nr:cation diffusion facilitator family transporter [Desulfohalobiaceae bacterium]
MTKSESKDKQPETEAIQNREAPEKVRRVTWLGFAVNIGLSFFKVGAGYFGGSRAVLADGVHSLTDCFTDLMVIAGSFYWSRPPDETHPYGHQRLETIISICIGLILLLAALGIGWEAIKTIAVEHHKGPHWIALLAAGVSVLIKEWLYRITAAVGKRVKSLALVANAWHHRLDSISSVPALAAVGVTFFFPALAVIDHIGAVVVSVLIFYSAGMIVWNGMKELMDVGAPYETCRKIEGIALQNPAVHDVHGIRTRYMGSSLQVDLHCVVDGSLSVLEGHAIARDIRRKILEQGPDVLEVVVHVEPKEEALSAETCL